MVKKVAKKVVKKVVRSERCSLHAVALLDPIWIDKWHELFPAHWKVGPAPVFGASRPLEPAEWLALLILKAGDVESNPGPQNRKLPPSALTTQTTTLNSTTHSHATTSHHNKKLLTLLQLNINSITNKHEELKLLVTELQPDIITIQETKLKKHIKHHKFQHTQQFALTEQTAKEEDSSLTLNTT